MAALYSTDRLTSLANEWVSIGLTTRAPPSMCQLAVATIDTTEFLMKLPAECWHLDYFQL
jgi:hypothetical protein